MFSPASPGVVYRPGTVGFEHPLSNVFFFGSCLILASFFPVSRPTRDMRTRGEVTMLEISLPHHHRCISSSSSHHPSISGSPSNSNRFSFFLFSFFFFFFSSFFAFLSLTHTHHPECPPIERQDKGKRPGDEGHGRTLCRDPVLHSPRRRGRHKKRVPPGAPRAVQGVAEAHHRAPRSLHRRLPPG